MLSKRNGKMSQRLCTWLAILLLGFGLSSCATVPVVTAPDFSQENWQAEYEDILLVGDAGQIGNVELITENYPQDLSGEFNSVVAVISDPQYDIYQDRWHTSIQATLISYGANIQYQLNYAGKVRTGTIRIPASPDMVLPIFTAGDYHFEWTISSVPDFYVSRFSYTYQSYFNDVREQLAGNLLEHTLQSEDWGGTVVYPLELELTALNFDRVGDGYIVVSRTTVTRSF